MVKRQMTETDDRIFIETGDFLNTLTAEKLEKYINVMKHIPVINPETAEIKCRLLAMAEAEKHKKIMS